jgi:hypothetical protein
MNETLGPSRRYFLFKKKLTPLPQILLLKRATKTDLQGVLVKRFSNRDSLVVANGKQQREGLHEGTPPNPPVHPEVGSNSVSHLVFCSHFERILNFMQTFPKWGSSLA